MTLIAKEMGLAFALIAAATAAADAKASLGDVASSGLAKRSVGAATALNPQPLPPRQAPPYRVVREKGLLRSDGVRRDGGDGLSR
jgi:hypothetical protein